MKKENLKEEIKQLEHKELFAKLDALRRDLFSLRLNSSTSHVKDYSQFKKGRKNIARVLTLLRQKGIK
jgi:large subunit ribosomal protein L29